jgi:hypothetical protein
VPIAGHSRIQNQPVKIKAPVAYVWAERPGQGLRISNLDLRLFAYTNMTPFLKTSDCDISASY